MGGETHVTPMANSTYPKLADRPVGQKIESIYEGRLRQFTDRGQYANESLFSKMDEGRVSGDPHVKLWVYSVPDLKRPTFDEAVKGHFKPTKTGTSFGPSWSTHWFRVEIKVPHNLRDKRRLEFHWDGDNEGMVWSAKGVPLQGLTGGGERIEWILPQSFRDGKEHTFYVEMACNGMFGNAPGDIIQPPKPDRYFNLHTADIVAVNLDARELYYDFWIIGDAAREFPGDSWEKHKALTVANQIIDAFIAGDGSNKSVLKGREIAKEYLGDHASSPKVYLSDNEPIVFAIGHCHIDTCWLWPWDETKRKVARSWSNQCDLMDRYPEHRFTCSQAQQYKWLLQYYPAVFDRVREKVIKGQFQPIGGSWVEHDTNMPSGESLVRQFLYGQRFFQTAFGKRCETFWLPDTFGYSTQIPQLCRLAGMSRFFTQKLSWNNINNFPHTTFNWVSLDGSQVLCHMAPAETYTAEAHFGDVKRSVTQHKSLDQDNTSLLVFGKGDGGGGPTFEHLEKLRRCRGLSDKTGLLPRVTMGKSVDDFFDSLEKKALTGKTEYTSWYGELYFELHRGTYTTQANNKWNNRKTEILMHDIEYVATLATLKSKTYKYPKKEIDDMWENILLCQFHDCLPGSSIEMCYDDSDKVYAQVWGTGHKLLQKAFSALGYKHHEKDVSDRQAQVQPISLLPWSRNEVIDVTVEGIERAVIANQAREEGLGALSRLSEHEKSKAVSLSESPQGVFVLENRDFQVYVEQGGVITSIYDKQAERQVLAKGGKANQLVIFDDKPLYWQAWDVEVFHLESRKEIAPGKTEVGRSSGHTISVVTKTQISKNSWIKSTVSLSSSVDESPAPVVIENEVEWRENKKFLKVEFPVDIVNTEASYETQYGIIRRPTHYNTSWDMAKFEVCCHKWADLSEANYGVSILNDSKYGFATCGNVMRLSLLRAPKAPDAHADMGRHFFKYAILPHKGPLDHKTVRAAYNFNHPMKLLSPLDDAEDSSTRDGIWQAIGLKGDESLILDAIKRGEDDEDVTRGGLPLRRGNSVILRVYESLGGKSKGKLTWDTKLLKVKKVFSTNVLEDDGEELDFSEGSAKIELRPFEVATYRLQL